uniref:G protein gamma domain-containing protein n=2 Tax=Gobiidae TaxID=8220 RepID=A0AAV2LPF0_KNICA
MEGDHVSRLQRVDAVSSRCRWGFLRTWCRSSEDYRDHMPQSDADTPSALANAFPAERARPHLRGPFLSIRTFDSQSSPHPCPRLPTTRTSSYNQRLPAQHLRTMEEMDVPQMRREVESLQYQLAINREKSSITVTELVKWIEGCVCEDPFLNPELMRANPWVEKGKCVIL